MKLSFKIWNEFACFGARGGILPAHFFDPLRHSVGSPVKYHHVSPQHPKRWVAEFDFRTIIASPQALTISTAQCLLFSALRESPLRPWWEVSKGEQMIERLGNVLYWSGCGLAFCWFVLSMLAVAPSDKWPSEQWGLGLGVGFVGGLVIWFIGRVARHYLAGR